MLTNDRIHDELMGFHGAQWKKIIAGPHDQEFIKSQLILIIQTPQEYFALVDPENKLTEYQKITYQSHALAEYGNFVTFEKNTETLSKKDEQILNIDKFINEGNHPEINHDDQYHQWLYALKNSGSLTGFDLLDKNFQQLGTDNRPLRFKILRFMTETMTGDSNDRIDTFVSDFSVEKKFHYRPYLEKPWRDRKQISEWQKRNDHLQKMIAQFRDEMASTSPRLFTASEKLLVKLSQNVKQQKNSQMGFPTKTAPTNGPTAGRFVSSENNGRKLNVREIAGGGGVSRVEETQDDLEGTQGPLRTIGMFLAMMMLFFGWLFWFMKRK